MERPQGEGINMAFTDPITLNDSSAVLQTFTRTSSFAGGSDWVENDGTMGDLRKISIRHTNAGPSATKGAKPLRRHFVQFVHEKWNAALGKTEKATFNVTITVDPSSALTTTNLRDLQAFLKNFQTSGILDQLLRDET